MLLETERLILRPWKISDAESLYEYAQDPLVGPSAGWPVHTSLVNSENVIKYVFTNSECYAVCLKENNVAIGCIELMIGAESNFELNRKEAEIGYWIATPFWGKGLIPEATKILMKHAFLDLGMKRLWCGYFDGNERSKRIQEKCGFIYQYTNDHVVWPMTNDIRIEHVTSISKEEWQVNSDL